MIIIGGGLAGLAAAAALGSLDFDVEIFEARGFLGGRATSWPAGGATSENEAAELVDNCQHVLMRCCVNLLDFYRRLGVEQQIQFYQSFNFIEPGGRVSLLKRGVFPAPAHFLESFLRMKCFGLRDKIAIARGMRAIEREHTRKDLDTISMLDWLKRSGQTPVAIERFWRQVLVSAINEELDRMAASHGFQVFWLGMLRKPNSYEMGMPAVPLRELYVRTCGSGSGRVTLRPRTAVTSLVFENGACVGVAAQGTVARRGLLHQRTAVRASTGVLPELASIPSGLEHSPITGIHLWFDRPITHLAACDAAGPDHPVDVQQGSAAGMCNWW